MWKNFKKKWKKIQYFLIILIFNKKGDFVPFLTSHLIFFEFFQIQSKYFFKGKKNRKRKALHAFTEKLYFFLSNSIPSKALPYFKPFPLWFLPDSWLSPFTFFLFLNLPFSGNSPLWLFAGLVSPFCHYYRLMISPLLFFSTLALFYSLLPHFGFFPLWSTPLLFSPFCSFTDSWHPHSGLPFSGSSLPDSYRSCFSPFWLFKALDFLSGSSFLDFFTTLVILSLALSI